MADDRSGPPRDSAPDLRILGDEITLQPSGFVQPPAAELRAEDNEEALMQHMAHFRSEPLRLVSPRLSPGRLISL
jgi:hypothetical protein